MEKFSSFERIVGKVSEHEKQKIIQKSEKVFLNQQIDDLVGKEREKTPEEVEVINLANQCTNEVRRKYGLEKFDIPAQNVHIIKKEKWPDSDNDSDAVYVSMLQAIGIKEHSSKFVLMKRAIHEMLHFKSYNAMQVVDGGDGYVDEYRVGLSVHSRDGSRMYFRNLDEAVTEEMTKLLMKEFIEHPLFVAETKQSRDLVQKGKGRDMRSIKNERLFNENTYHAEIEDMGNNKISVNTENFTKVHERHILEKLIGKIFEKNKDNFRNKQEIFEMFATSMMTGNIISIGKLIDKTFTKGTFRRIGELDNEIDNQEKFVDSLQ
jgi:hypothetical protein